MELSFIVYTFLRTKYTFKKTNYIRPFLGNLIMIDSEKERIANLAYKLKQGDRRSLSKAITLIESTRKDHRNTAHQLLTEIAEHGNSSIRIGLTGTPGVGKSTFIECLGLQLIKTGKKVAVLAVDPSSSTSGGSILGDKTRMDLLSRSEFAYIRPSPSNCNLGGVARRTNETIILCEAAGFEIILVETVGVGQSETMVAEMTDVFCLLIAPAGGDELQGVKRGIMEIADLILINKADGSLQQAAVTTCSEYASALNLFKDRKTDPPDFPKAKTISALNGTAIEQTWLEILKLVAWRKTNKFFLKKRNKQRLIWFERELHYLIQKKLKDSDTIQKQRKHFEQRISSGKINPDIAADLLIKKLFSKN